MAKNEKVTRGTQVKHRPTHPPVERQNPYVKVDRNHIFVAMDFNPLSEAQMAELEKMIHDKYEKWFPSPESAEPTAFHNWVRIFP